MIGDIFPNQDDINRKEKQISFASLFYLVVLITIQCKHPRIV